MPSSTAWGPIDRSDEQVELRGNKNKLSDLKEATMFETKVGVAALAVIGSGLRAQSWWTAKLCLNGTSVAVKGIISRRHLDLEIARSSCGKEAEPEPYKADMGVVWCTMVCQVVYEVDELGKFDRPNVLLAHLSLEAKFEYFG